MAHGANVDRTSFSDTWRDGRVVEGGGLEKLAGRPARH